jgi:hypothetical protein
MLKEVGDYRFPLYADVYQAIVTQSEGYGVVSKQWVLNKTISCFFGPAGRKYEQDVVPNPNIKINETLIGRTRSDIRISEQSDEYSIGNIIITNIRDKEGNELYLETSGPRKGMSTLFEVATNIPTLGIFEKLEFYRLLLRRSDNQAADL